MLQGKKIVFIFISFLLLFSTGSLFSAEIVKEKRLGKNEFLTLCYHDIPKQVTDDKYGVDQETFVKTIEYLLAHDYHFLNMDEIIAAHKGEKDLPPKSVLLTFDDGYKTFHSFVVPFLEKYNIPCILAIVSDWISNKPEDVKYELMNWEELKEVSKSPVVELACHTYNHHKGILYNPQGNTGPAMTSRKYEEGEYEREADYRKRVARDFQKHQDLFEEKLGIRSRIMCWPYGKYSSATIEEAKKAGLKYTFVLNDRVSNVKDLEQIDRIIISKNPSLEKMIEGFQTLFQYRTHERAVQVDLDLIYDTDEEQMNRNLSALLDRINAMRVSTVYLQAFADPNGDGNVEQVYFPNRVLPMRADLFNRVAHQLRTRVEVKVLAWMPMLAFILPDIDNAPLRVWDFDGERLGPSSSWYHRLSPFHPVAREKIKMIYEDLAVHTWVDGIIFQDDGYLNDFEDFNPEAQDDYEKLIGQKVFLLDNLEPAVQDKWTDYKTDVLNDWSAELMALFLYYRPEAEFARTHYIPVMTKPYTEEWFCQNYEKSLDLYDYVVLMAYPKMEKVSFEKRWFKKIVNVAKKHPKGLEKTVFKIQSFDWEKEKWISPKDLRSWLRIMVAEGARHLAYYPDDYTINQPPVEDIIWMMSTKDFPYRDR